MDKENIGNNTYGIRKETLIISDTFNGIEFKINYPIIYYINNDKIEYLDYISYNIIDLVFKEAYELYYDDLDNTLCILIIILTFLFNKNIYAQEYSYKNKVYYKYYNYDNNKIIRDYYRSNVRVNFYQINYLKDKKVQKEISEDDIIEYKNFFFKWDMLDIIQYYETQKLDINCKPSEFINEYNKRIRIW